MKGDLAALVLPRPQLLTTRTFQRLKQSRPVLEFIMTISMSRVLYS